jgi:hypothetical protein
VLGTLSILLAVLLGFLLVRAFDPVRQMQPRWAAALFTAALGAGVGVGLTSVIFLILDIGGAATPASLFGSDAILLPLAGWLCWKRRSRSWSAADAAVPVPPTPGFRWTWMLALAFAGVLAMVGTRLVQIAAALPVGDWDAWALWNLRAKFLAGPPGAWRYAFSPLLSNTHPDYPPLLSAFIASAWKAGGNMNAIAPVLTSLLFFVALLALLVSAVTLLRGAASGLLAGLVILSTTTVLTWAPAQYADIPVAFYYLGALALIFIEAARAPASGPWPLLWAGLCASFAAWTKNEGIVFLAIVAIIFTGFTLWRARTPAGWARLRWLFVGAAPGVLLTLWFKFFLAPPSDPLVQQGASGLAKVADLSRYAAIANGFFTHLLAFGSGLSHPLILLAILGILLGWQFEKRYRVASLMTASVVVAVFLSYCAVLLITPYRLEWQVQSSFDRLILQVWPAALLVFFLQLSPVRDAAVPPVSAKAPAVRKAAMRAGKKP